MQVPARHLPYFPTCTGDTPRGLFRRATRALAERCGREAETGARFLAAGRRSPMRPTCGPLRLPARLCSSASPDSAFVRRLSPSATWF